MTDKKISDLAGSTALTSTDVFEIDTGTASKKVTATVLADYVEGRLSLAELIRDTIASALTAGANITITPNDTGDSIAISANSSSGSVPERHPGYVSGRWYRAFPATTNGSVSPPANQLLAIPLVLAKDVTITDLGIRLTTGQASSHIVLGLYSNHSTNHVPDSLLVQTSALNSTASGVNLSESLTTPLFLSAGLYWLAALTDNASLSLSGMASTEGQLAWLIGATSATSIGSTPASLTSTLTYSSTLPSSFAAGATPSTSASCPNIAFKVA